jgi:hypothetical protein
MEGLVLCVSEIQITQIVASRLGVAGRAEEVTAVDGRIFLAKDCGRLCFLGFKDAMNGRPIVTTSG